MTEPDTERKPPSHKGRDYWIQFAVGALMLCGVFYFDIDTGGEVVKDWFYGIPTVVMLGVSPALLLESLIEVAKAYSGRTKQ